MKAHLPLWESPPNVAWDEESLHTYAKQRHCPPCPLICLGSIRGSSVVEDGAHFFYEALPSRDTALFVQVAWQTDASASPFVHGPIHACTLSVHPSQLREGLSLAHTRHSACKVIVVDIFAWHFIYQTTLSILIGRPLSGTATHALSQIGHIDAWLSEPRPAVLKNLAQNISSLAS